MEIRLYNYINTLIPIIYRNKFVLDYTGDSFTIRYNGQELFLFTKEQKKEIIKTVKTLEEDRVKIETKREKEENTGLIIPIAVKLGTLVLGSILLDRARIIKEVNVFLKILKKNTPVDTGRMRRGWRIKMLRANLIIIDNRVKYTGFVNDGTTKQRARKFVERSLEEYKKIAEPEIYDLIRVTYKGKG